MRMCVHIFWPHFPRNEIFSIRKQPTTHTHTHKIFVHRYTICFSALSGPVCLLPFSTVVVVVVLCDFVVHAGRQPAFSNGSNNDAFTRLFALTATSQSAFHRVHWAFCVSVSCSVYQHYIEGHMQHSENESEKETEKWKNWKKNSSLCVVVWWWKNVRTRAHTHERWQRRACNATRIQNYIHPYSIIILYSARRHTPKIFGSNRVALFFVGISKAFRSALVIAMHENRVHFHRFAKCNTVYIVQWRCVFVIFDADGGNWCRSFPIASVCTRILFFFFIIIISYTHLLALYFVSFLAFTVCVCSLLVVLFFSVFSLAGCCFQCLRVRVTQNFNICLVLMMAVQQDRPT